MSNANWFVAMPFHKKFDPVYEVIAKVAQDGNIECLRADKSNDLGVITHGIVLDMLIADLVVVDISTFNPNVFYELGIAHFLRKPTVLLSQELNKKKPIPFDIRGMFTIPYDLPKASSDPRAKSLGKKLSQFVGDKRDLFNPVSEALGAERICPANCYQLPFLWGYAKTLEESSKASEAWVVSHDLYWERLDSLFFNSILEKRILTGKRKELVLMPNSEKNRQGTEATILKFKALKRDFEDHLRILLIDDYRPFAFLPTEVSIYDPNSPKLRAIMLEPMASAGADRENDERIAAAYLGKIKRQQKLCDLKETTFDVQLSKENADRLAAAFKTIWNEVCNQQSKILWKM